MTADRSFDFFPKESEDLFHIARQSWIGGKQCMVRIDPGSRFVEVSGAEIGEVFILVILLPCH